MILLGTVGNMNVKLGAVNTDLKKGLKESEGLIESTVSKINSMRGQLLSIGAVAMPVAAVRNWAAAVNDLEDKTQLANMSVLLLQICLTLWRRCRSLLTLLRNL